MSQSSNEKIDKTSKKIGQLEMRKTRLEQREKKTEKDKKRRERTKRLIEVGAIFEKYFEIEGIEEAEKMAVHFESAAKDKRGQILDH